MPGRTKQTRDTVLLSAACAGGVVVAPQIPYVGLPVIAAAAAALAYTGRASASIVAAVLGVAAVALILPRAVVFAAPVTTVVLLAVWLLKTRSAQLTALVVTIVMTSSAVAADALATRLVGQSLVEVMRADTAEMTERIVQALGSNATAITEQLETVKQALVMLWPAFYVQSAIFGAVLVIAAISWAATRTGVSLKIPAMRELDLSVHVVWLLVVGLISLAAAAFAGQYEGELRAVGLNALYVARTLFFLQGIAVFSALFDVPKTGYGKMVGLYVGLYLLDQFLLIVSFTGLLDFWANFRRLPRDGSGDLAVSADPPEQYTE